jgi:hypothetical protein
VRIVETYSHLNGLEYMMVHRRRLWDEICDVTRRVNAEQCRTKVSEEARTRGRVFYSPVAMNSAFRTLLSELGWRESRVRYWVTKSERLIRQTVSLSPEQQKQAIEREGETPMASYNQTDFLKERIAVEVQFGKYAFVAYDLFVKHLAFFVRDEIDVGVGILPMKSLQTEMSSGVSYYEGELYNVVRNGRGVPAVPLVLVGIVP